MENWKQIFTSAAEELGCSVTEEQLRLFDLYRRELLLWNKKMSLLSLKDPLDLPVKHFADSLTVLPFLSNFRSSSGTPEQPRVIDVGSGGGFPGIPLLIANPSLHLTLLDSSRKKTSFLKEALRRLELKGGHVVTNRIETVMAGGDLRESFDFVVSRATFSLERLLRTAHHFLAGGGLLVSMKGPAADTEVAEAADSASALNMVYAGRHDLELPRHAGRRSILLYRKGSATGSRADSA